MAEPTITITMTVADAERYADTSWEDELHQRTGVSARKGLATAKAEEEANNPHYDCDGCGTLTHIEELALFVDDRFLCRSCSPPLIDSDPDGQWLYPEPEPNT